MDNAKKTLGLLDGIERIPAGPGFAESVMRRLPESGRAPAVLSSRGLRFAVAGLIALVALNVYALTGSLPRTRTASSPRSAAVDSLALDYGLTANQFKDLE